VSRGQVTVRANLFTPVSIIPPTLHTLLHVNVAHYQKDKRAKPGEFSVPFRESGSIVLESTVIFVVVFKVLGIYRVLQ